MTGTARCNLVGIAAFAAGLLALAVGVVSLQRYGPSGREYQEREAVLTPLLRHHASVQQVTQALTFEFTDYSRSHINHAALTQWLTREPATAFTRVRNGEARYPIILFHSTMWTMTWLFFDADGRLQDFYLCAQ